MAIAETARPGEKQARAVANLSDGFTIEVPANAQTYDGFLEWATSEEFPKRGRIDFIGGRLFIDMAAEEIHSHGTLKAALVVAIGGFIRSNGLGKIFTDRSRYGSRDAESGTEPDILFCAYDGIRSGRVRFVESKDNEGRCMVIEGSADLVVEIVSQSSVAKDTRELRERYLAAGVTEYWILDARGMRMTFDLLVRGDGDWRKTTPDETGFLRSEVLGRRIRVDRMTDAVGLPDYDVQIRE